MTWLTSSLPPFSPPFWNVDKGYRLIQLQPDLRNPAGPSPALQNQQHHTWVGHQKSKSIPEGTVTQ